MKKTIYVLIQKEKGKEPRSITHLCETRREAENTLNEMKRYWRYDFFIKEVEIDISDPIPMTTIELLKKRAQQLPESNVQVHLLEWASNPEHFTDAFDLLGCMENEAHDGAFTPDETEVPFTEDELTEYLNALPLANDLKAGNAYLDFWKVGYEPIIDPEDRYDHARKRNKATEIILNLGYPDPDEVKFDSKGVPHIQWKDPEFNCQTYYEELLTEMP